MQHNIPVFPKFVKAEAKLADFPYDLHVFISAAAVVGNEPELYIYKYAYTVKRAAQQQQSNFIKSVYKDRTEEEYDKLFLGYWMPVAKVDKDVTVHTHKSVMFSEAEKAHDPALITLASIGSAISLASLHKGKQARSKTLDGVTISAQVAELDQEALFGPSVGTWNPETGEIDPIEGTPIETQQTTEDKQYQEWQENRVQLTPAELAAAVEQSNAAIAVSRATTAALELVEFLPDTLIDDLVEVIVADTMQDERTAKPTVSAADLALARIRMRRATDNTTDSP